MVTTTRRRVPPRGNPEPQAPAQTMGAQAVSVPWTQIILTTAATTVTGYVVIELIKSVHRGIQRRRQAKVDIERQALQAKPQPTAAGPRPDGTFRLPGPDNFTAPSNPYAHLPGAYPSAAPPPQHVSPAPTRPQLVNVNTPEGQLRHDMHTLQRTMDARFSRLENYLMRGQYQDAAPPSDYGGEEDAA